MKVTNKRAQGMRCPWTRSCKTPSRPPCLLGAAPRGKGAGTGDGGAKRKPAVLAWGSANGKGVGTADAGKSGATGKPADASVG